MFVSGLILYAEQVLTPTGMHFEWVQEPDVNVSHLQLRHLISHRSFVLGWAHDLASGARRQHQAMRRPLAADDQ